jgi:APA family basic amino acid/polyamine antiporter
LPSIIAGLLGSLSPLAYVLAAIGNGVIMACFAELASRFSAAGGVYLYAREALGRFAGIQIGWMSWLVRITAAAANANLFAINLAEFWPRAQEPLMRALILAVLLGFLAAVNYRGVRSGAQVSNFFTIAKLVPLAIFLVAGTVFVLLRHPNVPALVSSANTTQWVEAVLLLARCPLCPVHRHDCSVRDLRRRPGARPETFAESGREHASTRSSGPGFSG